MDQIDIWRTAKTLINAHGDGAWLEAAQRADQGVEDGNAIYSRSMETALIRISILACLIATPTIAATYSPTDAKNHVGESATVQGIASVYVSKSGTTFVDLGGSGRSAPFTGVIFKEKASAIPNVQSYSGKVVDISGTIKDYQGKPEIVIDDASQLKTK